MPATRTRRCCLALLSLGLAAPVAPRVARADAPAAPQPSPPSAAASPVAPTNPVEEARRRYQRGVKFSKDGDFRSALVEFQEAYRVAPNFKVHYNVGQTCEELQDFAGAMQAFRRYLDQGGAQIPKAKRSLVEDELRQLEGHVARLDIEALEAGVELIAEGDRKVDLGKTPLAEAVLLNSGNWEVTARKEGFEPRVERITLAGGDHRKLVMALKRVEPPAPVVVAEVAPPPAAASPAPPPPPSRSMTPVWVGAGVTGALVVGAAVTGGFALSARSDYNSKLGTFGVTPGAISQASNDAKTLALVTDIETGAAILGAAVTTYLFFTLRPSSKPATTGVELLISPTGLGARGSF